MMNNIQLLAVAKKYVGKGGAKFRKYCVLPSNAPYCCAYVTYIFHEGGDSALFYGGKKVVYCPSAIKWCEANLALVPPYLAMPMDIGFFDWNNNGVPDHIGFIEERKSCDAVYTIEGNTSNGKSSGVVAEKTRNVKYVEGIYRPHFKATYKLGALEVDGICGYNTIAMMQKWLGVPVDGILGKQTVKKLQAWAGVNQDGAWGMKTSKAIQKKLKVTADGLFGKDSVKALQKYINKVTKSTPITTPSTTWQDRANAWARKISAEKYHYVKWNSKVTATHTCPICTGRKYDNYYGWNCIGYAFGVWHHGAGLKNKCSCSVISSGKGGQWDRLLKASQTEADKLASQWVGIPVTVIRNGGKAIPLSMLKAGDICCLYKNGTAEHIIYYMGNGKYSDSNTTGGIGSAKNIRADLTLSSTAKSKLKLAIRYTGK